MNITLKKKPAEVRLVVGGESRIDLLPPEVAARAQARSTKRAMGGVVVICLLVGATGVGAAALSATDAANQLDAARATSTQLIQKQGEFVEVREVQAQLDAVVAAQAIGASTEVNWQSYIGSIQNALPAGATLIGFNVEMATPLESYTTAQVPLQGARVASITMTTDVADLPTAQAWLNSLATLPGFVDASPGTLTQQEGGAFQLSAVMHVDASAYSSRFAPVETATDATGAVAVTPDEEK